MATHTAQFAYKQMSKVKDPGVLNNSRQTPKYSNIIKQIHFYIEIEWIIVKFNAVAEGQLAISC